MTSSDDTKKPPAKPKPPVNDAPLSAAIAAIAAELGTVDKRTIGKGSYSYKAFSVDDVFAAVRPMLAAHAVAVYPQAPIVVYAEHVKDDGKVSTTAQYNGRWLLVHGPSGDEQIIGFEASARDSGDKAPIQAGQQAFKYALVQLFQIGAGDAEAEDRPDDALDPLAVAAVEAENLERLRNGARQHLFELSGKDKAVAEERWPLLLTKAGLDGIMTEADQAKVIATATELYAADQDKSEDADGA